MTTPQVLRPAYDLHSRGRRCRHDWRAPCRDPRRTSACRRRLGRARRACRIPRHRTACRAPHHRPACRCPRHRRAGRCLHRRRGDPCPGCPAFACPGIRRHTACRRRPVPRARHRHPVRRTRSQRRCRGTGRRLAWTDSCPHVSDRCGVNRGDPRSRRCRRPSRSRCPDRPCRSSPGGDSRRSGSCQRRRRPHRRPSWAGAFVVSHASP